MGSGGELALSTRDLDFVGIYLVSVLIPHLIDHGGDLLNDSTIRLSAQSYTRDIQMNEFDK